MKPEEFIEVAKTVSKHIVSVIEITRGIGDKDARISIYAGAIMMLVEEFAKENISVAIHYLETMTTMFKLKTIEVLSQIYVIVEQAMVQDKVEELLGEVMNNVRNRDENA